MGKHRKWGKRLYTEQTSEDEDDTAPQFPWFVPMSGEDLRYPDALLADVVCVATSTTTIPSSSNNNNR